MEAETSKRELNSATWDSYLESTHIPGVACILQTVLIAFQEELQEKPVGEGELC